MSAEGVNKMRRRLLVAATSIVGAVGTGYALVPFVASMNPSARARAAGAPVEADVSKLEPGALLRVKWRGKPVWVVHRTPEMIAALASNDSKLVDPKSEVDHQPPYCQNPTRSIKPEYLVAIGICTHLGCSPTYRPEFGTEDLGADWKGGFHCPCHGSRFDLAARVFKNVPAPTNLYIPKHTYLNATTILVGEDRGGAA
ncbi:ubiquinol-cytochrome c reductase iron-sulfur subunit [Chromatium okenii]|jgi:ubiquinol-cytochrome c reductase iron-sulfur subunit|uniref:Ubiquinol-cytochrome c reductase iron-sulfur subunit n=1 Tax=Chromatium okenii TaxID=61644 RepID=A0A2S7XRJ8_9GAMM|nr:ubiquinol-cytochrome c reductase iron-sulfur subunit [Chromatium okenii]MBV5309953.1 ubiquinol-cytochrome c reductase iron-sulfur subunit [Chromatium okenii]PQJ96031.1 ubiquinol-cytochrome c reductase iron-sulfur subunit [Chromatium okenii]